MFAGKSIVEIREIQKVVSKEGKTEKYTHVALRQEQRLDLVFQNEVVAILEKLKLQAEAEGLTLKDVLIHLLSD